MSGMFVSRADRASVNRFNGQERIVAYLANKRAGDDAQDELHAGSTYYTQSQVAGIIDQTLAQTPVGPLGTLRVL